MGEDVDAATAPRRRNFDHETDDGDHDHDVAHALSESELSACLQSVVDKDADPTSATKEVPDRLRSLPIDRHRVDARSSSPSPSLPTDLLRPGAYRVRPGYDHRRSTSADDSTIASCHRYRGNVGTTPESSSSVVAWVEASVVEDELSLQRRNGSSPLSPRVQEATPVRRRRYRTIVAVALVGAAAIIAGIVAGFATRSPPPIAAVPPTFPPTSEPGDWFLPFLPQHTRISLQNPTSPQSRAFKWVTAIDALPRTVNPTDADQRRVRMLQRFVLATLYYATSGETAWTERRRPWLNATSSECDWWGCCCGIRCKAFESDASDQDFYGNETLAVVLTGLFLSGNGLAGTLPPEIGLLTQLQRLDLNRNRISGELPTQVAEVTGLLTLGMGETLLRSTIPTYLGRMTALVDLRLGGSNISLVGSLPTELGELSGLTALHLHANRLNGTLPTELSRLTALRHLRLDFNRLSGTIPSEWVDLRELDSIDLSYNKLFGSLPSHIGRWTGLRYLAMGGNALSGTLPIDALRKLTSLVSVRLQENRLESTIPSLLGKLITLEEIELDANRLTGSLPTGLGLLTALSWLSLRSNHMNWTLPTQLGLLTNLQNLIVGNNSLTGPLPSQVGQLIALLTLDVATNRLQSSIPTTLGLLSSSLRELKLERNEFTGSIPSELGLLSNLRLNASMRLDHNRLNGSVPDELCRLLLSLEPPLRLVVDCQEVSCSCNCTCA